MGRVSQKVVESVAKFLDSLPADSREKCALCNKTLTHVVKQAEARTGAGLTTVCDKLAELHNKTAAQQDRVTGAALRQRVLQHEGSKKRPKSTKGTNKILQFAQLLPPEINDSGPMVVGGPLDQWADETDMAIYKHCFTCSMEHDGPIRDFFAKKKNDYYCDKWETGYKSCWNCELHLQDDACPPFFWEFQDSQRGKDTPLYLICRKWQPRETYFMEGSEYSKLEETADA